MSAAEIGELSIKLADAALIARENGDDVHAIFFAVKAAETLALAKALGWKPNMTEVAPAECGGGKSNPVTQAERDIINAAIIPPAPEADAWDRKRSKDGGGK